MTQHQEWLVNLKYFYRICLRIDLINNLNFRLKDLNFRNSFSILKECKGGVILDLF